MTIHNRLWRLVLLLAGVMAPSEAVSRKYLASRARSENWEADRSLARGGIEREDVTVDHRTLHRMSKYHFAVSLASMSRSQVQKPQPLFIDQVEVGKETVSGATLVVWA